MLAKSGDDGKFFTVLPESVKLVRKGRLELLPSDVGQLSLGHEGLGLGPDELLLEDDNLGRIGLLVFELSNLIGDLLLTWLVRQRVSHRSSSWKH